MQEPPEGDAVTFQFCAKPSCDHCSKSPNNESITRRRWRVVRLMCVYVGRAAGWLWRKRPTPATVKAWFDAIRALVGALVDARHAWDALA